MDPKSTFQNDLKVSLKAGDSLKVSVIRMLMAEIKKREIDKKATLSESEIFRVIQTLIKQRREAAELFNQGNRAELAEKEKQEITYLQAYLPQPLTDAELTQLVESTVKELSASLPKDKGKVIKTVLEKAADRADGKRVSQMIETMTPQTQDSESK